MYRIVAVKDNRSPETRRPPAGVPHYVVTLAQVFDDSIGEPFDLPFDMVPVLRAVSRVHNRDGKLAVGMEFWLYANPSPDGSMIDDSPGNSVQCFFSVAQSEQIERQLFGSDAP